MSIIDRLIDIVLKMYKFYLWFFLFSEKINEICIEIQNREILLTPLYKYKI